MSTKQVAATLGISIGALQQLMFRGIIQPPARRLGPSYVWEEGEIASARQALTRWHARRKRGSKSKSAV